MRHGEIMKLEKRDIDLVGKVIVLRASTTKTSTKRQVPITNRLCAALEPVIAALPDEPSASVFGISSSIKKSFKTVCEAAGVTDFHFHDFRHSAITRMVAAGIPGPEVMKISGHTQMSTFLRYLNTTDESLGRARELLANHHALTSASNEIDLVM